MGNQPSSPHHSYSVHSADVSERSRHSRSQSRTSSVVPGANSSGHLKPHRSLRRKNKSIELPDLNGPIVPHARRVPVPSTQPIPITGGPANDRLEVIDAERRTGGMYGLHVPEDLVERAAANSSRARDHTSERNERRGGSRGSKKPSQVNHQQMANLLAQVAQEHPPPPQVEHPNPNAAYQTQEEIISSSPRSASEPTPGEIFHSRLRFGLEKHSLMKAGLIPRSETLEDEVEAALAVETPQEVTVISPSEVASGLVAPVTHTTLDALDASTAVEIKWTEGGEFVKLCLYSAAVVGLGIPDIIGEGEEGEGTYTMTRSEDGATFTKLLNLSPGTHHMRFLVSHANSLTPPSPSPESLQQGSPMPPSPPTSSFESCLSTALPTSPDPSGTLSNYVVVAPLKSPGVGVDGKLEVGEGGGAQVRPLAAVSVKRAVQEMPTPQLKLPPVKKLQQEAATFARGPEPGHSFWSKDSEDQDSDSSTEDIEEDRRREQMYEEQKRERERDKEKARWTSEIPLELLTAAEEEERFIEDCKRREEEANRNPGPLVQTGFHAAPPIPQPPVVPRHLDKLILNHKPPATTQRDGSPGGSGSPTRGGHGHRSRDGREGRRSSRLYRNEREAEYKPIIPVTTASGTDVTASALLSTTANAAAALTSASSFLTSASAGRFKQVAHTPLAPFSTTSTIPGATAVTDDASVLPVPSHVVLNHLSTSAIRNGVIAVGGTVRYREKYLTTIYYKPT
ncbi:5'-AMP-activated protein kinase beta subunit, interation domain-containing protein [Flagelloscypha sp. PMI_526]|nr:5'-AMP-activated protein kinase beta subunit, interation domain-containing protein [Flagelloscypha sp. PMI_526]